MMDEEEKALVQYESRDGQQIRLSFGIVRKFLVSGHPEFVSDAEIVLYMGQCKARGLNPFKKDCYLIKYTKEDPAATIVSIDWYRSRAKAQPDCVGWTAGVIIVETSTGLTQHREGALLLEDEQLVGGWFKGKPKGWETERTWTVGLQRYIKTTREGRPTRFWEKESQADMIVKVAESQGLRRLWPDEFSKLYVKEEIVSGMPMPRSEGAAKEPQGEPAGGSALAATETGPFSTDFSTEPGGGLGDPTVGTPQAQSEQQPKKKEVAQSEDEIYKGQLDLIQSAETATFAEVKQRVLLAYKDIKSDKLKMALLRELNNKQAQLNPRPPRPTKAGA